jgi:hypothetical protein
MMMANCLLPVGQHDDVYTSSEKHGRQYYFVRSKLFEKGRFDATPLSWLPLSPYHFFVLHFIFVAKLLGLLIVCKMYLAGWILCKADS